MEAPQIAPLSRLLSRLSTNLSSDPPRSQYERNKVGANIEHARTMLLTLEKQASTIRVQTQRQQIQADLQAKREVIKDLSKRLDELETIGDEEDDNDGDEDEEDAEDTAAPLSYAPARQDTQDGIDTAGSDSNPNQQLAEALQSQLRPRKPPSASDNREAASTSARESLFANRSQPQQSTASTTSETLLTHNRTEQENLTSNLLSLARALKNSSKNFGSSLESEKDVLKRAEGGLEKSSLGMEAAERKMGTLRRMSEGQGWWGRVKLYGMIGALWVALFLVVFVGPKIRL